MDDVFLLSRLGDAKAAAEAAAFIGPVDFDHFNASDLRQQVPGLGKVGFVDQLGGSGVAESPDGWSGNG